MNVASESTSSVQSLKRGVWVGSMVLRQGLLTMLVELQRRHGGHSLEMVPFSLFGRRAYLNQDPRHIGPALHDFDNFSRIDIFLKGLRDALGYTAATSPPADWQTVRQRTLRMLSGKILKNYHEIMSRVLAEDTVPMWDRLAKQQQPIDIFDEMVLYSSKVVFAAFLGVPKDEIPAHLSGTLNDMFDLVRKRVLSFGNLPMWVPTPGNQKFRELRGRIYDYIEQNLQRNPDTETMLEVVRKAHTKDGAIDRTRLFEEMVGNLIGGTETTIILMVWTLHYLSHAPLLQERLYEEVAAQDFNAQSLPRDSLLYRCLTEALRIRSPAYVAGRQALRPIPLGGIEMPTGTMIFNSQFITHTDPRIWPNPEKFDPDRFVSRPPRNTREYSDFFPFGGGRNICSGQAYAYLEAAILVSQIIRNFRLRPASPYEVGIKPELTLRPQIPVRVYAETRTQ